MSQIFKNLSDLWSLVNVVPDVLNVDHEIDMCEAKCADDQALKIKLKQSDVLFSFV